MIPYFIEETIYNLVKLRINVSQLSIKVPMISYSTIFFQATY